MLDAEKIRKKLQSETSAVRYLILIFLGAGINFSIGVGFMLSSLSALVQNPSQTLTSQSPIPTSVLVLVISYFVMGVVYATFVSLAFRPPKRIIPPLYIQITTSAFISILIVALQLLQPISDWVKVSWLSLIYFIISFVMFCAAGIGQTPIVRYLVGLNGTKEDTYSFGLAITATIEDVLKALRNDGFQEALSIREEPKLWRHAFLFRTVEYTKNQFFLVAMADPDDSGKTQLATVSYKQSYYGISKSGSPLDQQRKDTIKRALRKAHIEFSQDKTESEALGRAYIYSLSVTESKLLTLKSLPPYSKAIVIGVALMAIIMTALWKIDYITSDMFESFCVFAVLAILFDLLPSLKTKLGTKSD